VSLREVIDFLEEGSERLMAVSLSREILVLESYALVANSVLTKLRRAAGLPSSGMRE
jgi:hypothetical protein